MHRVDHATAAATLPTPDAPGTPGFFTGVPTLGGRQFKMRQQRNDSEVATACYLPPCNGLRSLLTVPGA